MKNIFSPTAITLIELLIASMLVSIVVLGLCSIDTVLNNNNQDYGQRFLLSSATQATLSHILNNASLAVSDTDAGDPGIFIGIPADPNTFCIHQDNADFTTPSDGTSSNTPDVYTDDRWLCYTWSPPPATATYDIIYCSMPYLPGAAPSWGADKCKKVGGVGSNSIFLGTAYSIAPAFPTGSWMFTATIQNCLNNNNVTNGNTCFTGTPDPVNNPEVTKTGSVATLQQGT